jgi:hypothetical protein
LENALEKDDKNPKQTARKPVTIPTIGENEGRIAAGKKMADEKPNTASCQARTKFLESICRQLAVPTP